MNFKNKLLKIFILLLYSIPINSFAYSKYVIPGGNTIGIEVNSNGVLVVGFYKVDDKYIGKDAGFEIGDKIVEINDQKVDNIQSMINIISNNTNDDIIFKVSRGNEIKDISFKVMFNDQKVIKTGLYVKDQITGIGTLTYIDPNSNIFGALGHEIIDSKTNEKFEIKDGKIFNASVISITKSRDGSAGEKNASYNKNILIGDIKQNDITGIYGNYTDKYDKNNLLEVEDSSNVKTGKAIIRTEISNGDVLDFDIDILKLDDTSKTKNILFEVVDKRLINEAGGIVQGMSGSPIIQNNKIVGAVNYVIVNDTKKGYGIFITTMLKEGEK